MKATSRCCMFGTPSSVNSGRARSVAVKGDVVRNIGGAGKVVVARRDHRGDAGGKLRQGPGVAVRKRQLGDAAAIDDHAERSRCGFERRGRGADVHDFGDVTHLQGDIHLKAIRHADRQGPTHEFPEARNFDFQPVGARQQIGELEIAVVVRRAGCASVRVQIYRANRRFRDYRLAAICDPAQKWRRVIPGRPVFLPEELKAIPPSTCS